METLQRTANRGSISTGPYEIDNSLKFEHSNAESLGKDQVQGTQTTWTFSTWLKRTALSDTSHSYQHVWAAGSSSSDNGTKFYFRGDSSYPENRLFFYLDNGGTQYLHGATSQSFRDTSAWYHIVWAVDTTQSTASDRSKVYINGELQTLVGVSGAAFTNPPQNSSTRVNDNGGVMYVGAQNVNGGNRFNGYLAETVLIDGSQLDVTDFGKYDDDSGIWIPKDVSGLSFGTRGFYLDYSDASNLGNDADGSTEFNEYNITAADQATDTPTNNFCTLNPLVNFKYTTNGITEGATTFGDNTGGGVGGAFGTFAVTKGKWYWEVKLTQQSSHYIGVSAVDDGDNVTASSDPHQINSSFVFNILNARIEYIDGGTVTAGSLDAFTDFHSVGDVISIALNMDDNQISMYGNGTLQSGVANTSIYDAADKMVVPFHGTINDECQYNFGGYSAWTPSSAATDEDGYGTFEYAPPSGYYALCSRNLSEYG